MECESGFRANPDRTGCDCKFSDVMYATYVVLRFPFFPYAAIPPPLSIDVPSEVNRSWFTVNHSNQYTVEIGREFQVLCVSYGEYSGAVTWFKVGNGGELFLCNPS